MNIIEDIRIKVKKIENTRDNSEYLCELLKCYSIPNATIERLKKKDGIKNGTVITIGEKIACLFTSADNLYAEFDSIKRNNTNNNQCRFMMLVNNKNVLAFDAVCNEWLFTKRNNISECFEFFLPLIGIEKIDIGERKDVNTSIGETVAHFYNEMLICNSQKEDEINLLLVNIVASLFADSCGIVEKGTIQTLIELYSKKDGEDLNNLLKSIFDELFSNNTSSDRYLKGKKNGFIKGVCPYSEELLFDKNCRKTLLKMCELNWDKIEPEVIGSLLQAIFNPEENSISYNYTSTANVYKVIGPLFIDDLYNEYEKGKKEDSLSCSFLDDISKIKVFDPACGTGNFLMVCYRELKKLEMLLKEYFDNKKIEYEDKDYVTIKQFYGIEGNNTASLLCKIGMAFINYTYSKKENQIIDLSEINICCGRALLMDWKSFCPQSSKCYIVGNPSYKGAHSLNNQQ